MEFALGVSHSVSSHSLNQVGVVFVLFFLPKRTQTPLFVGSG